MSDEHANSDISIKMEDTKHDAISLESDNLKQTSSIKQENLESDNLMQTSSIKQENLESDNLMQTSSIKQENLESDILTQTSSIKQENDSENQTETTEYDINDILICGLCNKYMQNPKWLPCLHSYCCDCLELLFDQQQNEIKDCKSMKTTIKSETVKIPGDTDLVFTSSPIKKEGDSEEVRGPGEDNSDSHVAIDQFDKDKFGEMSIGDLSNTDKSLNSTDKPVGDLLETDKSFISPEKPVRDLLDTDKSLSSTEKAVRDLLDTDKSLCPLEKSGGGDLDSEIKTSKKPGDIKDDVTSQKKNVLGKSNRIKCPACKEICELPQEGINGLLTNFTFINLIQMKEKLANIKHCDICKLRDITEVAVSLCKDCGDLLCKSCWQSHSFTRFTLSHKVIPLEEMDKVELDDTLRSRPETKCPIHIHEVLKYFCTDCKCLVCKECILLSHQGHSIVLSSEAAELKKKDFNMLLYGYNDELHRLTKDEYDEYTVQNERIANAEKIEIQKVESFFHELMEAIDISKNDIIQKLQEKFQRLHNDCNSRFSISQDIGKNRTNIKTILELILKQASDEEFLDLEPFLHQKVVHDLNKQVLKPEPISWYEMPTAEHQNQFVISYEAQKFKVSCFKMSNQTKNYDATKTIPYQKSLKELIQDGLYKDFKKEAKIIKDEENATKKKENVLHQNPNFIDATVWPNGNANNLPSPVNDTEILEDNDSSSSTNNELPVDEKPVKKKKRNRGARKKKNAQVPNIQSMFQGMSLHNKGTIGQPQTGLYGNSYATTMFGNTYGPIHQDMPDYGPCNTFGLSHEGISSYGPYNPYRDQQLMSSFNTRVENDLKMTGQSLYGFNTPTTSMAKSSSTQPTKSSNPSQPKQPSQNVAQGSKKKSPDKTPATASNAVSMTQNKAITLEPKFRLDVKLSSDRYEPVLRGVYCLKKTSIIVSDTKNGKVKSFSTEGQFMRAVDVIGVQSAIFTANMLIYCNKNEVHGKKEDGEEMGNPLKFGNKGSNNCLVTWSPKNHVLVAIGNNVRQYAVDAEKGHFVKKHSIPGGIFQQVQDVKCDSHGQKLVVIDASDKTVIICNMDGQVIGKYKEDTPSWNPTSACFDKKGNVFVTDGGGNRLLFLNSSGEFIQQWDTSPTINRPMFVTTNFLQPLYLTGHDRYVHVYDFSYC